MTKKKKNSEEEQDAVVCSGERPVRVNLNTGDGEKRGMES